jgi:hypothetical protein
VHLDLDHGLKQRTKWRKQCSLQGCQKDDHNSRNHWELLHFTIFDSEISHVRCVSCLVDGFCVSTWRISIKIPSYGKQ